MKIAKKNEVQGISAPCSGSPTGAWGKTPCSNPDFYGFAKKRGILSHGR